MIEPTLADINRRVVYTDNRHPGGKPERGVITGVNASTVFVRYGAMLGSMGTSRENLEWDDGTTEGDESAKARSSA
jgi:hypothetical protein